jgi:hypothetical protein
MPVVGANSVISGERDSYQANSFVSGKETRIRAHGFSRALKADLENGLQPLMEFMDEQ